MLHKALFGQLLIFGARPAVVGIGIDADTATRSEDARHLYIFRIHQSDKVFHDNVHAVFMKVAVVAETEQIELQALTLHHTLTGQVHYLYLGKVGLSGDGTQRCELGTVELHPVIIFRMFVHECLEHLGSIVHEILGCGTCLLYTSDAADER